MNEYQYLNDKIIVPKEWPLKATGNFIAISAEQAIDNHRKGDKVCLTVDGVSALVTDNQNGPGYIFKKTKEIHADATRIDLIVPIKAEIVMPEDNLLGPTGSQKLETIILQITEDHPISRILTRNPHRQTVLTATPIVEEILEKKGVRGNEKYDFAVRSIYIINTKLYNDVLLQKMSMSQTPHPDIFVKRFTEDKWIILFYDYLSKS